MNKHIKQKYYNNLPVVYDNDYDIVRNKTFTDLGLSLKLYDPSKVELKSFTTAEGKTIRYFWYKYSTDFSENNNFNKSVRKPSSRSAIYNNREPFEVEPWNQILIDESVVYGSKVDDNIEFFFENGYSDDIMEETSMSVKTMLDHGLVWVARSAMICHPDGYTYGEVDEILYSPKDDIYYVGDTKTSSSVVKISYGYQLATYIEILRLLNPDKNFSPIGVINHVKKKDKKWEYNRDWKEQYRIKTGELPPSIVDKETIKDHPIYRARWNNKKDIPMEYTRGIVNFNVDELQLTNLVRAEWHLLYTLLPRYGYFAHASALPNAVETNENIKNFNDKLQQKFNQISSLISE